MVQESEFQIKWEKHQNECLNKSEKEENVATKCFFHDLFIEAIEKDNYTLFRDGVEQLGISWHVKRNIPDEQFENFATYLWENKGKIQEGKYYYWESDDYKSLNFNNTFFLKVSRPYSYESKVCFVINPQGYYLIYDSYNCEALVKLHGKKWDDVSLKNFHKTAKEYIESKKLSTDENEYFKADFELWASGKELSLKKK